MQALAMHASCNNALQTARLQLNIIYKTPVPSFKCIRWSLQTSRQRQFRATGAGHREKNHAENSYVKSKAQCRRAMPGCSPSLPPVPATLHSAQALARMKEMARASRRKSSHTVSNRFCYPPSNLKSPFRKFGYCFTNCDQSPRQTW